VILKKRSKVYFWICFRSGWRRWKTCSSFICCCSWITTVDYFHWFAYFNFKLNFCNKNSFFFQTKLILY